MDASSTTMNDDTRTAFGELLQRHRGLVFKVANTYARGVEDRADLAQDIATQLWRAWPSYDPARSVTTWMYRIALNVAISALRGNVLRQRHAVPMDAALHDIADPASADPEADQHLRLLHAFIATLEPLNRALLLLYLDERSTREMADVLGLSESNVTTKISRLKQRLRDHVAPTGHA